MNAFRSFALLLFFPLLLLIEARADQSLAASTLVIYNKTVPESVVLAKFYAKQRGIPRDHLIGLNCTSNEEISRAEYDDTIADPLRKIFVKRGWWTTHESDGETSVIGSAIRFVALIKGVPMKIQPAKDYPGDAPGQDPIGNRNEASVDSELAVLAAYSRQISGVIANEYFQSFRAIADFQNPGLLLVCRLDAPSAATVKQMIVEAIKTEKKGLWGRAYVDGARNSTPGLSVADKWLSEIVEQCRRVGIPVVYDNNPQIFPDGFPVTDCALYYGWYTENIAGAFAQPEFHFLPGAIAVHIHSYSAGTLRDPKSGWVGPLVTKGAAASVGNVYEPYLQFTPQLDILNDRLLHGFTFAESAYMSMRVLSWMSVMVGDPLYRPYANWLQIDSQHDSAKSDWKMYHDFAIKNATRTPDDFRPAARQAAMRAENGPMMEDLGLLEESDDHLSAANRDFDLARTYYTNRDDIVRVVLEEANAWMKLKKPKQALELIRATLRVAPDSPAAPLLRDLETEASGRSPTPTPVKQ